MGNTLKPCSSTELLPNTDVQTTQLLPNTNVLPNTDVPISPISTNNNENPFPPLLSIDEINIRNKKWQQEKEERDKKDELYKNVLLTKEFLQQNIAKESWLEFQTPLAKHLTKDIHGFDILNFDLMEYGLKYSKYISSVKLQFVSKEFDDETIVALLRHSRYTLTFDTYNLIFYGDFIQNENILLSNNLENYIVLPHSITKAYNYIDINILNINNLLPILEKFEVKILVSTVEFNEFAEGRINYKYCFDQYYERNDETWNELNISGSGHSCVAYSLNMPIKKEETKEETKEEIV
jgi:hypothetical protein